MEVFHRFFGDFLCYNMDFENRLDIIKGDGSIALKSQKLVDLAENKGSTDNITALIICISNGC